MDVGELLAYQPEKPGQKRKIGIENEVSEKAASTSTKKGKGKANNEAKKAKPALKQPEHSTPDQGISVSAAEREKILKLLEEEPEVEPFDENMLRKMILQFEKKVIKNQEMRVKFPDSPDKFMESELELNDAVQELHVVATQPDLYPVLVELKAVQSLLGLLSHENTDIAIAVVDLLQELTDVDSLTESEEGANILIDVLNEHQVIALLVQNLDRLDEAVKEEHDGVHNSLAIVENICELRPEFCTIAARQNLLQWILKRFKAKIPFNANKLYASEILAILLQDDDENRKLLGEIDGIDVLLQQVAYYKRHDPQTSEETEYMENHFNCLCSALLYAPNRAKFLKGEGLQLMNLILREKKASRTGAIKVLDFSLQGDEGAENCAKFVDILGLRNLFPIFMKPSKPRSKASASREEIEERIVSIVASLLRNCAGQQKQRILAKFTENDHEKVDRLIELHLKYKEKVAVVDEEVNKERKTLRNYGDIDEEQEEEFYMKRLDAGLFTLQLIDYAIVDVTVDGPPSIHDRVMQLLNMRNETAKTIRNILREYAENIGDDNDEEARKREQQKLFDLVEKFC